MKRPVLRRVGDYWFLDRVDVSELKAPERVPPIDNHAYGLWQPKPSPDTSWVTTEDISDWPSARRPKQWYPGGGTDKTRIWVLVPIAWGLFAAVVLLIGTLS